MIKDKLYIIPNNEEIDEYIKLAGEYNLHFEYNDFFLPQVLDDTGLCEKIIESYKAIPALPADNTLHGAFLDVTIFSNDSKIRSISEERIRSGMTTAEKLGAKAVIIHTNYITNFHDDSYENSWVEKNAAFIMKMKEEYPGVSIYMENMFDTNPRLIARLAERLKDCDNFGICLDYAHVCVFGKECEPSEWMETLAPYIKHIHLNDNLLERDDHLPLGEGLIDISEFWKLYERFCPDATVLIEVKGLDKIRTSLLYLQKINMI